MWNKKINRRQFADTIGRTSLFALLGGAVWYMVKTDKVSATGCDEAPECAKCSFLRACSKPQAQPLRHGSK